MPKYTGICYIIYNLYIYIYIYKYIFIMYKYILLLLLLSDLGNVRVIINVMLFI